MVQSGLYSSGTDPVLDRAVALFPQLDGFLAQIEEGGVADSFLKLRQILASGEAGHPTSAKYPS